MTKTSSSARSTAPEDLFNAGLRGFSPVAVANNLDIELFFGPSDQNVKDAGLEGETPLWYYILAEAEVAGGRLGDVGGSIVTGVLVNLLRKGGSDLAVSLTS